MKPIVKQEHPFRTRLIGGSADGEWVWIKEPTERYTVQSRTFFHPVDIDADNFRLDSYLAHPIRVDEGDHYRDMLFYVKEGVSLHEAFLLLLKEYKEIKNTAFYT